MVSGITVKAGRIESYYARDDYYFPVKQDKIEVVGSGNKLFGFDQLNVSKREAFTHLVKSREVKAFDLTFSAPKSVSILFAVGNKHISAAAVSAHQVACNAVLKYIEENAFFRGVKKERGITHSYQANGMIALPILHSLSRSNDPLLHSHCLIANACIVEGEEQVRAVDFRYFYRNQKHFDLVYKAALRSELEQRGIRTRNTEDGFEVGTIDRTQIEAFSKRSSEIAINLADRGLSRKNASAQQRQDACLKNRKRKVDIDPDLLRKGWRETAQDLGVKIALNDSYTDAETTDKEIKDIIRDGLLEYLGIAAVTTRKEMVAAILKYARTLKRNSITAPCPVITHADVLKHLPGFLNKYELIRLPGQDGAEGDYQHERLVSVKQLRAETQNREFLRQGKELFLSSDNDDMEARLEHATQDLFSFAFEGEQRDAALGILQARDFITGVQGDPGTGKTTMLLAVAQTMGCERITGLCVSGDAAKKLGDETGLKCNTVAQFLIDVRNYKQAKKEGNSGAQERLAHIGRINPGDLIVVDEASMLGSIQTNELCNAAKLFGARIVVIGDRNQLPGVSAGKPFEIWQVEGMQTWKLQQIRRQRNAAELEAVEAITRHDDVRKAVDILEKSKAVIATPNEEERTRKVVAEYMKYFKCTNSPALLITGTNKSKDAFNDQIRERLIDARAISPKGHTFTVSNARGHEREKEFACGERIVFLKNESREIQFTDKEGRPDREGTQKVFNGTQAIIDEISDDGDIFACLVDEEGRRTERYVRWDATNYPYFDYSYALSTYKS